LKEKFWSEAVPRARENGYLDYEWVWNIFKNVLNLPDLDENKIREIRPLNHQYALNLDASVIASIEARKKEVTERILAAKARKASEAKEAKKVAQAEKKQLLDNYLQPTKDKLKSDKEVVKASEREELDRWYKNSDELIKLLPKSLIKVSPQQLQDDKQRRVDGASHIKQRYKDMRDLLDREAKQTMILLK